MLATYGILQSFDSMLDKLVRWQYCLLNIIWTDVREWHGECTSEKKLYALDAKMYMWMKLSYHPNTNINLNGKVNSS